MNNVSLTGRLTREPELRYGGQDNSTAITRFTLAVDDGKDTDFINIKCFGRTAEWAQISQREQTKSYRLINRKRGTEHGAGRNKDNSGGRGRNAARG